MATRQLSFENIPPEILDIILEHLTEFNLFRTHLTGASSGNLQNLRLVQRCLSHVDTIKQLLYRCILFRISRRSCDRLIATHRSIAPYVQKIIIEPSHFTLVQGARECQALVARYREGLQQSRYADFHLPLSPIWNGATPVQVKTGLRTYQRRSEQDLSAVKTLCGDSEQVFGSFTGLQQIDVIRSWDGGSYDDDQMFDLVSLERRDVIRDRHAISTSWLMKAEFVFGKVDINDRLRWRHRCYGLVHATWSILRHFLAFVKGEVQVNLGDRATFTTARQSGLPGTLVGMMSRNMGFDIEELALNPPELRHVSERFSRNNLLMARADHMLIRSTVTFISHISRYLPVDSLVLRGNGSGQEMMMDRPGSEPLYTLCAHYLKELTIQDKTVHTNLLFPRLGYMVSALEKLTLSDCTILHTDSNGSSLDPDQYWHFYNEAQNLRNRIAGKIEVVVSRSIHAEPEVIYSSNTVKSLEQIWGTMRRRWEQTFFGDVGFGEYVASRNMTYTGFASDSDDDDEMEDVGDEVDDDPRFTYVM